MKYLLRKKGEQILNQYNISITDERLAILDLFLKTSIPLDHTIIEKKVYNKISRSTVYRTLRKFMSIGLLHVLPSVDGITRYVIQPYCYKKFEQHIHFLCCKCNSITCLTDVKIPRIKIPEIFRTETVEILMKGTCDKCS